MAIDLGNLGDVMVCKFAKLTIGSEFASFRDP